MTDKRVSAVSIEEVVARHFAAYPQAKLSANEVARKFGCSPATARRVLIALFQQARLWRYDPTKDDPVIRYACAPGHAAPQQKTA